MSRAIPPLQSRYRHQNGGKELLKSYSYRYMRRSQTDVVTAKCRCQPANYFDPHYCEIEPLQATTSVLQQRHATRNVKTATTHVRRVPETPYKAHSGGWAYSRPMCKTNATAASTVYCRGRWLIDVRKEKLVSSYFGLNSSVLKECTLYSDLYGPYVRPFTHHIVRAQKRAVGEQTVSLE